MNRVSTSEYRLLGPMVLTILIAACSAPLPGEDPTHHESSPDATPASSPDSVSPTPQPTPVPSWNREATGFINFETPHVHPLDITPDGKTLMAVNLPDQRLETFDLNEGRLEARQSIPVGVDPVSVRARSNTEAWVINHVSDSISVVDLLKGTVQHTLLTGDEPTDVVFAGSPQRAFVTQSQLNQVWIFDPQDLDAAPTILPIQGEDPRALTVDATGRYVLAAIFEAGNDTTIVDQDRVSRADGPYGGVNPPPNDGDGWKPEMAEGLATPPPTGLIVRKDTGGKWRDDSGTDWSSLIPWNLHGHDVAIIDTANLVTTYAKGLMNANMALAPRPDGKISVVGIDANNHIRMEPNVNGTFLRVVLGTFDPAAPQSVSVVDLNPHLDYSQPTVSGELRALSIGDPRAVQWIGETGFVAGMGSNTVVVIDGAGSRLGQIEVGEGPTGLAAHPSGTRLFVLNKFSSEVVEIDPVTWSIMARQPLFDPTPDAVREGRPFLYDTRRTSGLGHISCGSCHIDGRNDQLAWDLGDPRGAVQELTVPCFGPDPCPPWHPMKGPLTTQTLVGIIGTEPLHWRGDKENFLAFKGAYGSVQGSDQLPTDDEMGQFEAFVATLRFPPNPYRNLDSSLPTRLFQGGNAVRGMDLYLNEPIKRNSDAGDRFTCVECHSLGTGTNSMLVEFSDTPVSQSIKTPQLRNMHERSGFDMERQDNNRGFGYFFDGEVDTLYQSLDLPALQFPPGPQGVQDRLDLEALLLAFNEDPPAGVGAQVGFSSTDLANRAVQDRISLLYSIAATGKVGMVARSYLGSSCRGYSLQPEGDFQSDRAFERVTLEGLRAEAQNGAHVILTLVAAGTETRIGIDRDADGALDGDELDAGTDPASPPEEP